MKIVFTGKKIIGFESLNIKANNYFILFHATNT